MPNRLAILRDCGFIETRRRVVWVNPIRRQAFSEDCINDHDKDWLIGRLAEHVPDTEFWFHFRYLSRDPMTDCKEILSQLPITAVLPVVRTGVRRVGSDVVQSN